MHSSLRSKSRPANSRQDGQAADHFRPYLLPPSDGGGQSLQNELYGRATPRSSPSPSLSRSVSLPPSLPVHPAVVVSRPLSLTHSLVLVGTFLGRTKQAITPVNLKHGRDGRGRHGRGSATFFFLCRSQTSVGEALYERCCQTCTMARGVLLSRRREWHNFPLAIRAREEAKSYTPGVGDAAALAMNKLYGRSRFIAK